MRNFIDIIILAEGKSEVIEVYGDDVRVYENPVHEQFKNLLRQTYNSLRFTICNGGDLYVWDSAMAIHSDVEDKLGISAQYRGMLKSDRVIVDWEIDEEDFRSFRCIQRAYGNMHFDIENDSLED